MNIYLAARFSRKDELASYIPRFEEKGATITSRWLTGAHDGESEQQLSQHELMRFAIEDLEDIHNSDIFILFTEDPEVGYTSGGRMVEFGFALAMEGLTPVLIGPSENVFHTLVHPDNKYESIDDMFTKLDHEAMMREIVNASA